MIPALLAITSLAASVLSDAERRAILARIALKDYLGLLNQLGAEGFRDLLTRMPPSSNRDEMAKFFLMRCFELSPPHTHESARSDLKAAIERFNDRLFVLWVHPNHGPLANLTFNGSNVYIDVVGPDTGGYWMTDLPLNLLNATFSGSILVRLRNGRFEESSGETAQADADGDTVRFIRTHWRTKEFGTEVGFKLWFDLEPIEPLPKAHSIWPISAPTGNVLEVRNPVWLAWHFNLRAG